MSHKPDPILAAISAHAVAHDQFSVQAETFAVKSRRVLYAADWKAAKAAYAAATDTLVRAEISSVAGAQAFAAYLAALHAYGDSDGKQPCCFSIEVWHLSDAMARIAEVLAQHCSSCGPDHAILAVQALPAWPALRG